MCNTFFGEPLDLSTLGTSVGLFGGGLMNICLNVVLKGKPPQNVLDTGVFCCSRSAIFRVNSGALSGTFGMFSPHAGMPSPGFGVAWPWCEDGMPCVVTHDVDALHRSGSNRTPSGCC